MKKISILAHRGAFDTAPENTLIAFRKSMEQGCHAIELDVQLTKDQVPVIIHDETLNRTAGVDGFVKDFTFEEIRKLSAGNYFSKEFEEEKIPTLEEFFELVSNWDGFMNVELKTDIVNYEGIEQIVLNLIEKYSLSERIIISSFNPETVRNFKKLNNTIRTAFLFDDVVLDTKDIIAIKEHNPYSVHLLDKTATKETVQLLQKEGFKVYVYTVNEPSEIARMKSINVDGIFTDYVARAEQILNGKIDSELISLDNVKPSMIEQ